MSRAKQIVKDWWCRLRSASLYITKEEQVELAKRGLDHKGCILIERDKDGTGVFVEINITGPYVINARGKVGDASNKKMPEERFEHQEELKEVSKKIASLLAECEATVDEIDWTLNSAKRYLKVVVR